MNRYLDRLNSREREIVLSHISNVPVKLSALARELGIEVKASTLPAGISGEIRPSQDRPGTYTIRVNRHDSEGRQRFTVAHEIAHYLLHRDKIGAGLTDDALYRSKLTNFLEIEANQLAADILMPTQFVRKYESSLSGFSSDEKIAIMAREFGVSEPAMKIRLGLS
ncbi:ImmA/IrrE family metallo-endopeptidase [Ancylobacter sp. A5.8]|uniref:ImmA/IrrE family metallo-endopeptidase n=1 Tax=Ancylobacter gelatini TaxID=2919920 RepID=UPI001F4EDF45|nr:ImmA/IrrE family metallo-endopeptidase [Ancylobacter gelatini]MCJ8143841.1 ImmA/IrrE family metallo-endopeptidase [Ancylobacter gelatini]